jgi:hypothetical protein
MTHRPNLVVEPLSEAENTRMGCTSCLVAIALLVAMGLLLARCW